MIRKVEKYFSKMQLLLLLSSVLLLLPYVNYKKESVTTVTWRNVAIDEEFEVGNEN